MRSGVRSLFCMIDICAFLLSTSALLLKSSCCAGFSKLKVSSPISLRLGFITSVPIGSYTGYLKLILLRYQFFIVLDFNMSWALLSILIMFELRLLLFLRVVIFVHTWWCCCCCVYCSLITLTDCCIIYAVVGSMSSRPNGVGFTFTGLMLNLCIIGRRIRCALFIAIDPYEEDSCISYLF